MWAGWIGIQQVYLLSSITSFEYRCLHVRGSHRVVGQLVQSSLSGPVHCRQVASHRWHFPCWLKYSPAEWEQQWTAWPHTCLMFFLEPRQNLFDFFLTNFIITYFGCSIFSLYLFTSFVMFELMLRCVLVAPIITNTQLWLFSFHWRSSSLSSAFWHLLHNNSYFSFCSPSVVFLLLFVLFSYHVQIHFTG